MERRDSRGARARRGHLPGPGALRACGGTRGTGSAVTLPVRSIDPKSRNMEDCSVIDRDRSHHHMRVAAGIGQDAASPIGPGTLSLSPLTILDASPPEQVSAAAGAGFDGLGIRVWPAADERIWPMLGDTPTMRDTLAKLSDSGLGVLDVELIFLRPEHRPQDALAVLDAGHRLGARFALVLGYDPDESRLTERFGWLCDEAQQRGIRPGLEFMKYSAVQTLDAAVRVVRRAGHPAGAVLVDALHLQRSGGSPADLAAVPRHLLPYGQLCDGPLNPVWPDDDSASDGIPHRPVVSRRRATAAGRTRRSPPGRRRVVGRGAGRGHGRPIRRRTRRAGLRRGQQADRHDHADTTGRNGDHSMTNPSAEPSPHAGGRRPGRAARRPHRGVRPAGGRWWRGRAVGGGHRRLPRAQGDRRGEGGHPRRRDRVVRRLDVGAAEPAVAGRRDRRGHRRAADVSQTRAGRALRRTPGGGAAAERPAHGGVLREQDVVAVRVRLVDRRHPGRPTREPGRAAGRSDRNRSTSAGSGRICGSWSGRSCTRRRSSGWASWPAPTCRRSCTPRRR